LDNQEIIVDMDLYMPIPALRDTLGLLL
jgi:hypothetical protein